MKEVTCKCVDGAGDGQRRLSLELLSVSVDVSCWRNVSAVRVDCQRWGTAPWSC